MGSGWSQRDFRILDTGFACGQEQLFLKTGWEDGCDEEQLSRSRWATKGYKGLGLFNFVGLESAYAALAAWDRTVGGASGLGIGCLSCSIWNLACAASTAPGLHHGRSSSKSITRGRTRFTLFPSTSVVSIPLLFRIVVHSAA
ncbi:hypothetical protein VUR80DRAFT_9375 [Thermomyces stellatus]